MARYTVKDNSGRTVTFDWHGDSPPTDSDMEEVFSASYSPQDINLGEMQTDQPVSPETSKSVGRGLLEMGGAAVGTLGGIPGEIAGYAAGSKGADYLYGENTGSIPRKLAEGAAFSIIPRGIAKGLTKAGESMVGRALKIPPTKANAAVRSKAVKTMVAENIGISDRGLTKVVKNIDELDTAIRAGIDKAAQGGAEVDVGLLESSLDALKQRFSNRPNPKAYEQIIDQVKGELATHPYVKNGKIPVDKAHELKKGIYQELDSYYSNLQSMEPKKALAAQTENVAKAAYANSLREEIMNYSGLPKELSKKLEREASLVNIKRWLNRAAARAGNHDVITFNDVLIGSMVKTGIPEAVAARFLRAPRVQARLGIMFAQLGSKNVARALQAGAIYSKPVSYLNP